MGKAAAEAARRFGVVRGSRLPHQMLAMAAISPPPPCRPWDRADLMRRLGSFKAMTWFAKPKVHFRHAYFLPAHVYPYNGLVAFRWALAIGFEKLLECLGGLNVVFG